jgi:hypothetical protein
MTVHIAYERLLALVEDDRELVTLLISEGLIVQHVEGFTASDLDRAMAARTLLRELEVNLPGIDIILRLREEVNALRHRIAELEGSSGGGGDSGGGDPGSGS